MRKLISETTAFVIKEANVNSPRIKKGSDPRQEHGIYAKDFGCDHVNNPTFSVILFQPHRSRR